MSRKQNIRERQNRKTRKEEEEVFGVSKKIARSPDVEKKRKDTRKAGRNERRNKGDVKRELRS
jgi:hypothetical protein